MPSTRSSHRLVLAAAVLSLVVLGSCLAQSEPSGEFDRCRRDPVTAVPYPDRPASLTNESVRTFAANLEEAYVLDRKVRDNGTVEVSFDPQPDEVTELDDGWSVRIDTGLSVYTCTDGSLAVSDGAYVARYFINESAVYRSDSGSRPVADPRERGVRIRPGNATSNE